MHKIWFDEKTREAKKEADIIFKTEKIPKKTRNDQTSGQALH